MNAMPVCFRMRGCPFCNVGRCHPPRSLSRLAFIVVDYYKEFLELIVFSYFLQFQSNYNYINYNQILQICGILEVLVSAAIFIVL